MSTRQHLEIPAHIVNRLTREQLRVVEDRIQTMSFIERQDYFFSLVNQQHVCHTVTKGAKQ